MTNRQIKSATSKRRCYSLHIWQVDIVVSSLLVAAVTPIKFACMSAKRSFNIDNLAVSASITSLLATTERRAAFFFSAFNCFSVFAFNALGLSDVKQWSSGGRGYRGYHRLCTESSENIVFSLSNNFIYLTSYLSIGLRPLLFCIVSLAFHQGKKTNGLCN